MPFAIAVLWFALLALRGSYDQRIIGLGTEEIRRIVPAARSDSVRVKSVSAKTERALGHLALLERRWGGPL